MSTGKTFEIMLLEDNPADALIVEEALSREGLQFDLQTIDDGEDAMAMIDSGALSKAGTPFDIFIVDLNLPKVSGREILQRLSQLESCSMIPRMVFSSSDSPDDRAETLALGAKYYFRKPFNLDEYMKIGPYIRQVLEHQIEPTLKI